MTNKVLKLTILVIAGIVALNILEVPQVVQYTNDGVYAWNWLVDRTMNFRIYHPTLFACLPFVLIVLLARK